MKDKEYWKGIAFAFCIIISISLQVKVSTYYTHSNSWVDIDWKIYVLDVITILTLLLSWYLIRSNKK